VGLGGGVRVTVGGTGVTTITCTGGVAVGVDVTTTPCVAPPHADIKARPAGTIQSALTLIVDPSPPLQNGGPFYPNPVGRSN
jgi:hypothetical protein